MTDVRMHRCPAPTCEVQVMPEKLMCSVHWAKVPAPLQTDLYSAVCAYKATSLKTPNVEFNRLRRAMHLAQNACVNAVRAEEVS